MTKNEAMIEQFLTAMATRDLTPTNRQIVPDGRWHRCTVTTKAHNNDAGSYLLNIAGPKPFSLYCNWTDGKEHDYWNGKLTRKLTKAEEAEYRKAVAQARAEAEKERAERAAEAASIGLLHSGCGRLL